MGLKYATSRNFRGLFSAVMIMLTVIAVRKLYERHQNTSGCRPRTFKTAKNIVCVCTGNYCDIVPPLPSNLPQGKAALYLSSQSGKRFSYEVISALNAKPNPSAAALDVITVDPSSPKQQIIGFGGAFTDAAGINIASLSKNAQAKLIESYFGQSGLEYTLGRIPMASCDFSVREYSYDDVPGDFDLTHFALAKEDIQYKIPSIKAAMSVSKDPIKLFGSPWSGPGWMKTTGKMKGNGTLIGPVGNKYHKAWANYFVKFIQEYANNDISIWGLTAGNEPTAGFAESYTFQAMGFTPETQRDFVKTDLGPALASNNLANVKLMIFDDQRNFIPQYVDVILNDSLAAKYISGVAVHWYSNPFSPATLLDYAHDRYPEYFILATEACTGFVPFDTPGPAMGEWSRAERYAKDIIEDINHWASGWVDWNLALDLEGGPNFIGTRVDSTIIVNKAADEFYKQPIFYALGHFSKFVRPDSVRIESTLTESGTDDATKLDVVAFTRPDSRRVAVVLNRNEKSRSVNVKEKGSENHFQFNMDARSIATVIWSA